MGQSLSSVADGPIPAERERLDRADDRELKGGFGKGPEAWRRWGCYTADRQWGTVREDYSRDSEAWNWFSHDDSRSRAYRWGEDALLGFSDDMQFLNFSLAMWNGKDAIIKERLFGLTNAEGPHGEDVKEVYYFEDALPSGAYMRAMYRYPMGEYPYAELVQRNGQARKELYESGNYVPEVELHETGVLDSDRFWDITIEYAKNDPEDISIRITVENCSSAEETVTLLPSLCYRNTWSWEEGVKRPVMRLDQSLAPSTTSAAVSCESIYEKHHGIQAMTLLCDGIENPGCQALFCDNETRLEKFEGRSINRGMYKNLGSHSLFPKDCINNALVSGEDLCNPEKLGSKMAYKIPLTVPSGMSKTVILRLLPTDSVRDACNVGPFDLNVFEERAADADEFYDWLGPSGMNEDHKRIRRQAFAGMLWTRQVYLYDVAEWLREGPEERWDLAFHIVLYAHLDPSFAKEQALVLFRSGKVHPKGSPPAYEWDFGDYSPPLAPWCVWKIYEIEEAVYGTGDMLFLQRIFPSLNRFYSWYLNLADHRQIGGSFLGLDNIAVVDRSKLHEYPALESIAQADGTSWAAVAAVNMLQIALKLELFESASAFFSNIVYRAHALNNFEDGLPRPGFSRPNLFSEEMNWYCDVLKYKSGEMKALECRSFVGIIPLFATHCYESLGTLMRTSPLFLEIVRSFCSSRIHRQLASKVVSVDLEDLLAEDGTKVSDPSQRLGVFLVPPERLRGILWFVLHESHFLSAFGIRSASREHEFSPFVFEGREFRYIPRESFGHGLLFGGNSSWRGAIWIPTTFYLLQSLLAYHDMLGESFTVECPSESGREMNLKQVSVFVAKRLVKIFERHDGARAVYGTKDDFYNRNPRFSERLLFYEYFDGCTGFGVGASHQTGWTGLVADLVGRLAANEDT